MVIVAISLGVVDKQAAVGLCPPFGLLLVLS